jgi:hypothetical protein
MEFVTFKHGGSVAWFAHLEVSGDSFEGSSMG